MALPINKRNSLTPLELFGDALEAGEEKVPDREPGFFGGIKDEVDVFNQLLVAVVDDVV